ncbi:MAG: hypothetical protein AVDCRST_MAG77-5114 [uncultured Chloroflexi bacterium]|uniref:SCP domain-containing protein n=1 Tax=uncultured Chloroflexota bacterium TaxID=166587 RepID=A0A6J4K402_9CHLR|nr:MAG: hypothetical protein AVDCRST_MAG77-5114 [uncultured Chloroflexota bacterium]
MTLVVPRSLRSLVGRSLAALLLHVALWGGATPVHAVPQTGATGAPAPQSGGNVDEAVAWLNGQRLAAGSPPVTLDPALSAAATAHARYLALNKDHPATLGLHSHEQDMGLPGATPEGKESAAKSNISRGHTSVLQAIQALTYVPFHRLGMLDPRLQQIGVGVVPFENPERFGYSVVIDVGSAVDIRAPRTERPAVYPVPGQTDVPLAFPGNETPDPRDPTPGKGKEVGFVITVEPTCGELAAPRQFVLRDETGNDVPVWTLTLGTEVGAVGGSRKVHQLMAFSQAPLRAETAYRVTASGACGDRDYNLDWTFRTGGKRLEQNTRGEYVVRVPEQMDFATASNRETFTETQRESGILLMVQPGTALPEEAWRPLFGWKARVEMTDGTAPDMRLLRPLRFTTWGEWPRIWDYEGGPQFALAMNSNWPQPTRWGTPASEVVVEGRNWVLKFSDGTKVYWTFGGTQAQVVRPGDTPPAR